MMHRAWSSIVEVPYCFSRSYVKFQGHTALKIVEFDPNWTFPDSNSSLNSPMAMKCCTKLETAKERCPVVFQGHPSNFKVTRDKTSPILTQIGRFRTIGRSQLSNPSDLPCFFYQTRTLIPIDWSFLISQWGCQLNCNVLCKNFKVIQWKDWECHCGQTSTFYEYSKWRRVWMDLLYRYCPGGQYIVSDCMFGAYSK